MKKYIRDMIDDLQRPKNKNVIPPVPKAPADGKTDYLNPPPEPPLPDDLANQDLSDDPSERVRQLDFQAQQDEERENS